MLQMPDSTIEKCTAGVIAQNILSRVDQEGRDQALFKEILDHQEDPDSVKHWSQGSQDHSGLVAPGRVEGWDSGLDQA